MHSSLKKPFILPVSLIALSILLVIGSEIIQFREQINPVHAIAKAEKNLHGLEQKMSQSLREISTLNSDSSFHSYFIHHGFQELGLSFFYILNEKITKWSDNETDIGTKMADTCQSNSLIHLNNGWYEIFIHKEDNKEIIGLVLIRKEYAYENQYLVNSFNPVFGLPPVTTWVNGNEKDSYGIRSVNNEKLFHVTFSTTSTELLNFDFKSWLYLAGCMFFLFAVFLLGKIFSRISSALVTILVLLLVAGRTWMIYSKIPDEFYSTPLFNPQFYASSFYFNSLGDLFINSMIMLCIAGIFYHSFGSKNVPVKNNTATFLFRAGSLIFIFLLSLPLNNLVSGLIVNSKISFDVSNIFGMNAYSFLGLLVIAVLLWSYFLITFAFLKRFFQNTGMKNIFMPMLVSISVFLLVYFLLKNQEMLYNPAMTLLVTGMTTAFFIRMKKNEKKINLNFLLTITLLFSVYSSFLIRQLNDRKEKENRKLIAQKIETGQDRLAEYLFEDLSEKISNDEIIQRNFKDALQVREQVNKRLMQFYFTGYWGKFNISLHCFNADGLPFDSLRTGFSLDSLERKAGIEENQHDRAQLHFVGNETSQQQYISIIPVHESTAQNSLIGSIAVELTPKLFQTDEGFPELFVSRKVAFNKELTKYSFARYERDSLVSQSGSFAYYFSANVFQKPGQEYSFEDHDGYNHLIHRINSTSFIVVSKSADSNLILFTLFSYLFSIFSLLLLIIFLLIRITNRDLRYQLNLTRRIQSSVMLLVILSFVLIGSGTVYYITDKYDANKDESIRDKINPLLAVVEKEFSDAPGPGNGLNDETHASLIRVSGILNTDFNLFNPDGELFYSSQPKIFEQGIISKKMNPEALLEMNEKGKTQFVITESIGKLRYISAYEPFRNRSGKITGYLHLPYFEKQNELNNEISNFLSALINIYVLLFALAVIVTLFISSRITQPLLLIQDKLSNIRLGKKNELIEYRRRDEIGELVNEYNRMIEELAASAEKLARGERESAWREMAKQVAHEIKNPLTPMKLSVQHLQRAWKENSPQLNEIFERISETLVQQIDTLSNIAAEFSNFAQMPQAKKEAVDLNKTLASGIDLFKELPDISILFSADQTERFVFADKDQLIRVISNLLKNAIQAIPSGKKGIIKVGVETNDKRYIISVNDNGTGIPNDQLNRIFVPSFTTKSGGMGLGLSIVKSIVESSDGKIWFETREQEGTTFYISLPVLEK